MLGQLHSGDFSPHIGRRCLLECGAVVIETVVESVVETPLAANPFATAGTRLPFMLHLRGAPDCPWSDGTFTLKVDGGTTIEGVYVSRILSVGPNPGSLFQAVFN